MDTIRWLADIDTESDASGSKEIKQLAKLRQAKFPILPGFVITSPAYRTFLQENKLDHKIAQLLSTISHEYADSVMQGEALIKQLFERASLSDAFKNELAEFYQELGEPAVRISIHEAGPQERKYTTFTADTPALLEEHIKNAWAEMFTGHALWHRHHRGVGHFQPDAEIIVQEQGAGTTTGTIITVDPHDHAKDKLFLTMTHPHAGDTYVLSKKNLTILDRKLHHTTNHSKLSHDTLLTIATMAKDLETHLYFPQEISWAIDGDTLYIMGIKPFTSLPKKKNESKNKLPVGRGKSITPLLGTGVVTIIHTPSQMQMIKTHHIVVVPNLEKGQISSLKKARGVIVENKTHPEVAVMLQKHGIPAIDQVKHATKSFKNGTIISIHGGKGEIYLGGFH